MWIISIVLSIQWYIWGNISILYWSRLISSSSEAANTWGISEFNEYVIFDEAQVAVRYLLTISSSNRNPVSTQNRIFGKTSSNSKYIDATDESIHADEQLYESCEEDWFINNKW